MSERTYRVWIEKHESGWIIVTAPSEDIAKDRAQERALRDWRYPEHTHATPCAVERTEQPK